MELQEILDDSLTTSTAISRYLVEHFIAPQDVIAVLNGARVKFMLVGAYGLVGWTQTPRATQDVDVLVGVRGYKKAVKALRAAFPDLEVENEEVVTRFRNPDNKKVIIDVLKPNQPLYREGLRHTVAVLSGGQSYKVPSLEMALAMKFAPMISLTRDDAKKHLDAHDFIQMVRANPEIDADKLAQLGELVYPGGGQEILEKVRQVRAGEKLYL
jgi:hypothetical protein